MRDVSSVERHTMKTKFEQVVDVQAIGKAENHVSSAELFALAAAENLPPADQDAEKTLLLAVDLQLDFMDDGALGVKGAKKDVERLTRFMYDNIEKISAVAATCDCHSPMQIFHACWWQDENGNEPVPFTIITKKDLNAGRWTPRTMPEKSAEYLEALEKQGKKRLCIWPYHCLEASVGGAIEPQFSNMANFFSAVRRADFKKFGKGRIPYSEFYGALRPEYCEPGTDNTELLEYVSRFNKIIVAGEAMDYCVYETISQLCEELQRIGRSPQIFVLTGCTSSIGPREEAEKQYAELTKRYGITML